MQQPVPNPAALAVPLDLANQLAAYLSRQPFADVAGLIMSLQQCRPVDAPIIDPGPGPADEAA